MRNIFVNTIFATGWNGHEEGRLVVDRPHEARPLLAHGLELHVFHHALHERQGDPLDREREADSGLPRDEALFHREELELDFTGGADGVGLAARPPARLEVRKPGLLRLALREDLEHAIGFRFDERVKHQVVRRGRRELHLGRRCGEEHGWTRDWPANEHGIFVDHNNFVWVAGNGMTDGMVLKFTRAGKFVLQIGKSGPMTDSKDTTQFGRAADMVVDPATNELYVADGYFNHRVIVFDATTGAFKRMWGAYGKPPTDDKLTYDLKAPPAQQFANPVHGIRLTKDGLVFVSDRGNNRAQVFRKDGTFVREYIVLKDGLPGSVGSTMLWPDAAAELFRRL